MKRHVISVCVALLAAAMPAASLAADTQGSTNGWRRVGQPTVQTQNDPAVQPDLIIPPGTFVTARVDQVLSSDANRPGDAFSATLLQPIVVDGIVVASRGQTVVGRVVEAERAGRGHGASHLGIELTELTLVDGQQAGVQTRFIRYQGPSSGGRNVATIAGTTTTGALIGAIAEGGMGAGIGAGVGAAAGGIGVLLTRGRPTVVYPESVLTFQTQTAVAISTGRAPSAFRSVTPADYQRADYLAQPAYPPPPPPPPLAYGYGYPYPYYPRVYPYPYPAYPPYAFAYPYPYSSSWGWPFYSGPGFTFFFGRGHGYYGHYGHGHWGHGHH